jgi:uncharacterized protein (DUF2235 family)
VPKNIVILLDGTSNQISDKRTNVLRLYGALKKDEDQLVYYDPGVGTFSPESWWSRAKTKIGEVVGLATGWGLDDNVKQAYRFLVENYEVRIEKGADGKPVKVRDTITIFGFSRGAYTARVLAGFINALGLIEPRNLNLLDYAYRAYKRIGKGAQNSDNPYAEMRLFERSLKPDRPPIRMLGLFDTVSSVIEHFSLRTHAFTSTNPSVEAVMQAAAIEERRTMFPLLPWPKGQSYHGSPFDNGNGVEQRVEEVWFAGVHCDVGGGHSEAGSALCKVPLVWMINRAKECGVKFSTQSINSLVYAKRKGSEYTPPSATGAKTESLRGAWWLLGSRRRPIEDGATLHESVLTRRDAGLGWASNIPSTFGVWKDETDYEASNR